MKTLLHSAHVVAYHANKADIFRRGSCLHDLLPHRFMDGSLSHSYGTLYAIECARFVLKHTKLASREFNCCYPKVTK